MEWAGRVLEVVAGRRLGEVMQECIFAPLGMTTNAFTMTPSMRQHLALMHQRETDGSLTPLMEMVLPQEPELHMGGHGPHSTVPGYCRIIRMWLNEGAGKHGRVLRLETVAMAVRNGVGAMKIKCLPGVVPFLSNNAELFPGMPKSWALSFMVDDQDAPTGRPAGSLAWAGLANLYYWIDRRNGIGGFWATQMLPFVDPTSTTSYLEVEAAVYANLAMAKTA